MYREAYYSDHANDVISDETEQFAINTVFKGSRYLFISKAEDGYSGYCTHCKAEFVVDKLKHNSKHDRTPVRLPIEYIALIIDYSQLIKEELA